MPGEDARSIIEPELEIVLARMAERFKRRQENLPLWLYELLEAYGEACAVRAIRWMHERRTMRPSSSQEIDVTDLVVDDAAEDITPVVDMWQERNLK